MKAILPRLLAVMSAALLFSSCAKDEKPYAVPPKGDAQNAQVSIGEDYETQVYFSLTSGQVAFNKYRDWDLAFTTGAEQSELWMNGGKGTLIYASGKTDFATVIDKNTIPANAWVYDNPSGLSGESGLGLLADKGHIGEVLVVNDGDGNYYKVQVTAASATAYNLVIAPIAATTGTAVTLTKDDKYNYVYYSFSKGAEVQVEPEKTKWDLLFTRYRHVYYKYNEDGSDMLYAVNGVLTNPYKTESGDDSLKAYDFNAFSLTDAEAFTLHPNVDVIGFDWKTVNINTSQYTVNPKSVFVIKDQQGVLWKMHFVNFYDAQGKKGNPQFEYQNFK